MATKPKTSPEESTEGDAGREEWKPMVRVGGGKAGF